MKNVNVLGFLPYLWPVLSVEQKKELSLMVSYLVKEEGVQILALLPSSDMGLIFENFDITKLTWEWRDIQLLGAESGN